MIAFASKLFGERSGKREIALILLVFGCVLLFLEHGYGAEAFYGGLAYAAGAFGLEGAKGFIK